jgi:glycosyltransferase involved in cell wall biosynthesis
MHALAALRRRRTDWRALFIGDGDAAAAAERLSVHLGLADAVDFLGFVADRQRLVRLIATCDVCLSPEPPNELNRRSTLIKVAEYMAVGKPIVAFDLRETRATAGEAAVYAATPGPDAYAREIDALLEDPDRRQRMGEVGRRRVVEELSWTHSEQHLLAAYERATGRATH